jgi:hypothetical protein
MFCVTNHQILKKKLKVLQYHLLKGLSCISIFLFFSVFVQAKEIKTINPLALEEHNLKYTSSYNGINLEATRSLKNNLGIYTQEANAKNILGDVREISVFKIDKNGSIAEIEYKLTKSVLGVKKEELLTYDQSLGVAKYRAKKKKRQIFKQEAHLNNLTSQIKLQSDLINQVQLLSYAVIRRGKIKLLNYTIIGEEFLKTELGIINTLKLKRTRQTNNRETFLWFAPQWNYLLVKLEQKEKGGENYTMLLREGSLNHTNLMK